MAEQRSPAAPPAGGKPRAQATPAVAQQGGPSGLTEAQAKEFHEQFKVTYTAFVGIAAVVHLMVIAANPWF